MKFPDFSEFTFGYALTDNLIHRTLSGVRGVPIFPSLKDEGQSGVGYDVKIPRHSKPLFLQFKLPQVVKRHRKSAWGHNLNPLYYRMHLMRSSDSSQHRSLLRLARKGKDVFYVAPEFHSRKLLGSLHSHGEVPQRSAFFDPKDIGFLSDEPHHIAYKTGAPTGWVCSDPREIKRPCTGKNFAEWINAKAKSAEEIRSADDFFSKLLDSIINASVESESVEDEIQPAKGQAEAYVTPEELFPDADWIIRQKEKIRRELDFQSDRIGKRLIVGYASRLLLDCELLILGHGKDI